MSGECEICENEATRICAEHDGRFCKRHGEMHWSKFGHRSVELKEVEPEDDDDGDLDFDDDSEEVEPEEAPAPEPAPKPTPKARRSPTAVPTRPAPIPSSTDQTCPVCERTKKALTGRGVCKRCLAVARAAVARGDATWKELEAAGIVTKPRFFRVSPMLERIMRLKQKGQP